MLEIENVVATGRPCASLTVIDFRSFHTPWLHIQGRDGGRDQLMRKGAFARGDISRDM